MKKRKQYFDYPEKGMYVVKFGDCRKYGPEIWLMNPDEKIYPDEPYDGEQARFATRNEAEAFIRKYWPKHDEDAPEYEMKYRGVVTDELGTMDTRKTKWYSTYKEAHDAAEKLCKRTMGDRGRIDVEQEEVKS